MGLFFDCPVIYFLYDEDFFRFLVLVIEGLNKTLQDNLKRQEDAIAKSKSQGK